MGASSGMSQKDMIGKMYSGELGNNKDAAHAANADAARERKKRQGMSMSRKSQGATSSGSLLGGEDIAAGGIRG
jgi:hypothetical protein